MTRIYAMALLLVLDGACAPPSDSGFDTRRPPPGDAGPTEPPPPAMLPPTDPGPEGPYDCGEASFELTETDAAFVVPNDVRFMHVKIWGAGGNQEARCDYEDGGPGGFTEAVFDARPGEMLTVVVGHYGRAGISGEDPARYGFGSWGGGGLSGIFRGAGPIEPGSRDRAMAIAGGGGSAAGGACSPGGPGNHPDAGGMDDMHGEWGSGSAEVTGGAGGYSGGLAGSRDTGGRGGSGFVADEALDSRILYSEPGSDGPPAMDDPDYADEAGTREHHGRVVIHYVCEPPGELI